MERQPEAGAQSAYPRGITVGKFEIDGRARPFPGNTIISHLPDNSELRAPLLDLYERLKQSELHALYTLLPPSSWHMTVFEGVCDLVREPGFWPADLPLDAPLAACHSLFEGKLASFRMGFAPPLELEVAGWKPQTDGIALHLEPATAGENSRLRDLRDRLSDLLQIRHPGHETYVFHLSVAYLTRRPSEAEGNALAALLVEALPSLGRGFKLGAPEFCHFDDMHAFERRLFLT